MKLINPIETLYRTTLKNVIYFSKHLLLIPTTVMNKVFDMFVLDVYLNTLQRKTYVIVKNVPDTGKDHMIRETG